MNSTHGVTRLVSFDGAPQPVPDDLVSALRARCDGEELLHPEGVPQPGERVRLVGGPFAGFVAEVEKIAPDRRVWLLLEMMGGHSRLLAAPEQLRAV